MWRVLVWFGVYWCGLVWCGCGCGCGCACACVRVRWGVGVGVGVGVVCFGLVWFGVGVGVGVGVFWFGVVWFGLVCWKGAASMLAFVFLYCSHSSATLAPERKGLRFNNFTIRHRNRRKIHLTQQVHRQNQTKHRRNRARTHAPHTNAPSSCNSSLYSLNFPSIGIPVQDFFFSYLRLLFSMFPCSSVSFFSGLQRFISFRPRRHRA